MKDKYDVILKEKPIDEGLGKTEIIEMLSNLKDEEIIPLEIEATKTDSSAMGFITYQAVEMLNFYYKEGSNFGKFIIEILEDMNKENKDCHYKFGVLDIYMDR